MRTLMLIVAGLLAGCASLVDDGLNAYNRGEYRTAEQLWTQAALEGDSLAMNNLGAMYQNYYKDTAKAINWYTMAARHGNSYARVNLQNLGHPIPAADLERKQGMSDSDTAALMMMYGGGIGGNRLRADCTSSTAGSTTFTSCK